VVAAIQALGRAYSNYYAAIADYDRAQFRLYRALGEPAQYVSQVNCNMPYVSPIDVPHRQ
jgi:hypothetical protein